MSRTRLNGTSILTAMVLAPKRRKRLSAIEALLGGFLSLIQSSLERTLLRSREAEAGVTSEPGKTTVGRGSSQAIPLLELASICAARYGAVISIDGCFSGTVETQEDKTGLYLD